MIRPGRMLAALGSATLCVALFQALVSPALPVLQRELGTSTSDVAWILTAYLLAMGVASPILGRLGDVHGKRHVLLWVIAATIAGSLVCAFATSLPIMIAGRVVQGVGGAIFPLSFGLVRDHFRAERTASAVGFLSSVLGVGAGCGVVLSGLIIDGLNWHWLFLLPCVVQLAGFAMTLAWVPETTVRAPGTVNWAAATLLSAGLVVLLFAVSRASTWGWGSPKTLGLAAVSGAILALWIAVEARARQPLVDVGTLRLRGVWTANAVAFLLNIGLFSAFVLIPEYAVLPESTGFGLGASATQAGLLLLPMSALMMILGPLTGRLERRSSRRTLIVVGCVASIGTYLVLLVGHDHRLAFLIATALLGVGMGLAYGPTTNVVLQSVPPEQTGVATAMTIVARTAGGSLGAQVVATLLAASVAADGLPTLQGFEAAFAVVAVALVGATAAALAIPRPALRRAAVAGAVRPV